MRWIVAIPVFVLVLTAAGGQAATDDEEFSGVYVTGFEASEFYPNLRCPENIPWWLEAAPDSGFFERLQALDADGEYRVRFYRVRITGHVSPRGQYGHLGVYPRLITVSALLDAEPAPDCDPRRTAKR